MKITCPRIFFLVKILQETNKKLNSNTASDIVRWMQYLINKVQIGFI
jgi:hypothetical protein